MPAHIGKIKRVHQCDRIRLNGIEHRRAPRHAAGVPMLQLPPGNEHHRVFGIGAFIGANDVSGHKTRTTPFTRKVIDEHDGLAGIAFFGAWISHCVFTLQTIPGDAADAWHGVPHFVKHFGHVTIVPVEA